MYEIRVLETDGRQLDINLEQSKQKIDAKRTCKHLLHDRVKSIDLWEINGNIQEFLGTLTHTGWKYT